MKEDQESRKEAILNSLINNLRNGDEKGRKYALNELIEMPNRKSIVALVETLADTNGDLRTKAETLLSQIDVNWPSATETLDALPTMVYKLSRSSDEVWKSAARFLGTYSTISLPFLIEALDSSEDDDYSMKIIQTIKNMEGDTSTAVPNLVKQLGNPNPNIKEEAIKALSKTGSEDISIIEELKKCISDENYSVRQTAIEAIPNFGIQTEILVRPLVESLLDKQSEIRHASAKALGFIGEPVVGQLVELIEQRKDLRKLEIERLQRDKGELFKGVDINAYLLEPSKATNNMRWHLDSILEEFSRIDEGILLALNVLEKVGKKAIAAAPVLLTTLDDIDPRLQSNAIKAIGALGSEAGEESVSDLLSLYKFSNNVDNELVVKSLNNIQPDWASMEAAQPFLNHLIASLGKDMQTKLAAIVALKAVDGDVVKTLVKGLDDTNITVREEIIHLLSVLGDKAKDAIPFLVTISKEDNNRFVREAAAEAMGKIGFTKY